MAQRYGRGKYRGGTAGVFVSHSDGSAPTRAELEAARREAEEAMRRSWETAVPLGDSGDIFSFALALSVGDISEDPPGVRRKSALEGLYGAYPNREGVSAARSLLQNASEAIHAVRQRAKAGESIRVWYSDQPDEMCGCYWFMAQLSQWAAQDGQVALVKLPEWEVCDETIVRKTGWGELSPGQWGGASAAQKPAPPGFIRYCASHWQTLQAENAPLRAVLNGRLVSAPETLYDRCILREIEAESEEFSEAVVIGRVLGTYQLGIGDGWVALRIEEMIRAGTLEAVSKAAKNMPAYHRMLKKRSPTA